MEQPLIPNYNKIEDMCFIVTKADENFRLDQFLVSKLSEYTRSFLTKLIKGNHIALNKKSTKPSAKIREKDVITVSIPKLEPLKLQSENIHLEVLYEDEWLAAINKRANLVVHPARGKNSGTLVNGLIYHFNNLSELNGYIRPGIVHRLDRFTSGVILIAKNNQSHAFLAKQFEMRQIKKEYIALTEGVIECKKGNVNLPIGMDTRNREKMSTSHGGKNAETNYEVICSYPKFSLVHVFPKTGRTHQIRVHMKALGHPIVADDMYGAKEMLKGTELLSMNLENKEKYEKEFRDKNLCDTLIDRQALHAWKITFIHPHSKKEMSVNAPLPSDFSRTLEALNTIWPSKNIATFGIKNTFQ